MNADHNIFDIEGLKLINSETNKIWTITVDGESITTQLDNRKPKTITDEFPDLKARQLIMGQMKKGFVYSSPEADVWNPCYRTYINKVYTGFMPIASNKNRSDFYVIHVVGQFEDEIISHYDNSGQLLDSFHLGKDRLTYRAILLDDGKILMHFAYSTKSGKFIALFDPSDESIIEIQEGELLQAFEKHDDHSDIRNDIKVSYIGYNDPYNRDVFKIENIQTASIISEIHDLFISKNAFCAFTSDKLVIRSDIGVLSLYNIPK